MYERVCSHTFNVLDKISKEIVKEIFHVILLPVLLLIEDKTPKNYENIVTVT